MLNSLLVKSIIKKDIESGEISGTSEKASKDSEGNVITETYATKKESETSDELLSTAIKEEETRSNEYTDQKIADLINGAPATLDTLKEIADAMDDKLESEVATDFSEAETPKFQQTINDVLDGANELKSDLSDINAKGVKNEIVEIYTNKFWNNNGTLSNGNNHIAIKVKVEPNKAYSFKNINITGDGDFCMMMKADGSIKQKVYTSDFIAIGKSHYITIPNDVVELRLTSFNDTSFGQNIVIEGVVDISTYQFIDYPIDGTVNHVNFNKPIFVKNESLEDIIKTRKISTTKVLLKNDIYMSFSLFGSSNAQKTNDGFTFTSDGQGSKGIYVNFKDYNPVELIHIKMNSNAPISIYVFDKNNKNNFVVISGMSDISGNIDNYFDPSYYTVYEDIDVGGLIITCGVDTNVTLSNVLFYQGENTKMGETVDDALTYLDSKETTTSNDIGIIGSDNGDIYRLCISNGNLKPINVKPTKALFIGNSLLLGNHKPSYTLEDCFGLCAGDYTKDYCYLLTNKLSIQTVIKKLGVDFEGSTTDQQAQNWIDNNITTDNTIDAVFIQLGDNVNTLEKVQEFNNSTKLLCKSCREAYPNAIIYWIGLWYSSSERINSIKNACSKYGCVFVDITDINIVENQGYIGQTITYKDGTTSIIQTTGEASHPGDLGMSKIADRIYEKIGIIV